MQHFIVPQYFSVGSLHVHYYGVFMALAVAAGYWLAVKRSKQYGISLEQADKIIFWIIIGGFLGARAYHILSSFGFYSVHPLDMLKVWNGGLSIYGALIGGVVAVLVTRGTLVTLDWLAPSLLLGQIIGRFGNFFNYELYGYPTGLPWKMYAPPQFRLIGYQNFSYFHPLFLYEVLANAIILFFLLRILHTTSAGWRKGALFFWYLLLYNAVRFGLEFMRMDSTYIEGVRINAYVSLLFVIISVIFLIRSSHEQVS